MAEKENIKDKLENLKEGHRKSNKDRGVGDNVYVWAYNSVRGLWLSIGNFRIEEREAF